MNSQIFDTVEQIKLAYLSHTPVVWVVTSDKEIASQIAEQFVLEHLGSFREKSERGEGKVRLTNFDAISRAKNSPAFFSTPRLFYKWYVPQTQAVVELGGAGDTLWRDVEFFISAYEQMVCEEYVQGLDDSAKLSVRQSLAIIASPTVPPSSWINRYVELIYVKPINDSEILEIINQTLRSRSIIPLSGSDAERLVVGLRGFSPRQVAQTIERCVVAGYFDAERVEMSSVLRQIRAMKRQLLEGFRGLKWIDVAAKEVADQNRSLGVLCRWLDEHSDLFDDVESSVRKGHDIPSGVLITGIPGTGKSMMAKVTAQKLGLPLISLDMGDLQEGIVGASEQHMAQALRLIEAMAPCVLWIDEIEKAFSGSNSSASDGGVMQRMFGKFLIWMQEKSAPVFVFATSNDITKLPSELFRSERFDERFYSFMPMAEECAAIFAQLVSAENSRYKAQNPDADLPLFDSSLESSSVWVQFLDAMTEQMSHVEMEGGEWKDGEMPQCKLFTGADISSLLKKVKFRLLRNRGDRTATFNSRQLFSTTLQELESFMPYGQTNVSNIADCFLKIAVNRFLSASDNTVVRFEDYNIVKRQMKYDPQRYSGAYNRALYATTVGAINFYAKQTSHENR